VARHPAVAEALSKDDAALRALTAIIGPPRPGLFGAAPEAYASDPGPSDEVVMALTLLAVVARGGMFRRAAIALTPGAPAALAGLLTPSPADPRIRCAAVVCGAARLLAVMLEAKPGEEMSGPFITRGLDQAARAPLLASLSALAAGGGAARFGATASPRLVASGALERCAANASFCYEQLQMFFNANIMSLLGGASKS
jgi:hypothetical protein